MSENALLESTTHLENCVFPVERTVLKVTNLALLCVSQSVLTFCFLYSDCTVDGMLDGSKLADLENCTTISGNIIISSESYR